LSGCAEGLKHSVSNYRNANAFCTISESKWLIDGAWCFGKSADHQGIQAGKTTNSLDNLKIIFPILLRCEGIKKKAISSLD
jgi:hypothetical protein